MLCTGSASVVMVFNNPFFQWKSSLYSCMVGEGGGAGMVGCLSDRAISSAVDSSVEALQFLKTKFVQSLKMFKNDVSKLQEIKRELVSWGCVAVLGRWNMMRCVWRGSFSSVVQCGYVWCWWVWFRFCRYHGIHVSTFVNKLICSCFLTL